MQQKLIVERQILDKVYKDQSHLEVIPRDKPDFLVKNSEGDAFGVEVTQLYNSESDARLKNLSNYWSDLLEGKEHRHKKDRDLLKVQNVLIQKTDGREREAKVIIQEMPKPLDYLLNIKNIIVSKTRLKRDYSTSLAYTNLIIQDYSEIFALVNPDEFYKLFFTDDIISEIVQSDFREIFLITRFEKEQTLILRLKLILFSSRIYLFHEILKDCQLDNAAERYYEYLAEFLNFEGLEPLRLVDHLGEPELIYSNIGFTTKGFTDLTFRDYGDYHITRGEVIDTFKNAFITEEVEKIIFERKRSFGFSTNIGFES